MMLPNPRKRLLPGLCLALLSLLAQARAQALPATQELDSEETAVRGFSIPNTQGVRALVDRIEEHIAALRWADSLVDLQRLLEQHSGDVLPGSRPRVQGRRSEQLVYEGAADYAQRRLLGMPQEFAGLYRRRYESKAQDALEVALVAADRRALAEIARRWPITAAAERAWWALGDLELELGNPQQALSSWTRALRVRLRDHDLPTADFQDWSAVHERVAREDVQALELAGIHARIELAMGTLRPLDGDVGLDLERFDHPAHMQLPGPDQASGDPPARNADSWAEPYSLPMHPFTMRDRYNLFPVQIGDAILVSTSLQLICINAFTGREVWSSDEPPGWSAVYGDDREGYFKGIDENSALIAPAASGRVAVAALQVPVTQIDNKKFQQIQITTIIPDRRLFAYDLETGAELWDHAPPPLWDGETGSFQDRMSVSGPPVIAGSRLLAPFSRMRGRIDYHVGCFDLATGELLWSTDLISGQRPLNMFGRHELEFCAPPLRVAGDRVIALTQLGTLAALDLFTGEILWETLYDQIRMKKTRRWASRPLDKLWRNAQPIVADGVVVATPEDSQDMIGVDLETGALLWSLAHTSINSLAGRTGSKVDLLLGADDKVVYLGGSKLLALEAPLGLFQQSRKKWNVRWVLEDPALTDLDRPPRPVLGRDRIVIPAGDVRLEIDRYQGLRTARPTAFEGASGGHLLLGEGLLFSLNNRRLTGYFEWDLLLDRARSRQRANPRDRVLALELGRLLGERGRSEASSGYTEPAAIHLVAARRVLEPLLDSAPSGRDPEVGEELHGILLTEARVRTDLAQEQTALSLLRKARALAPDPQELMLTLLEEEALVYDNDDRIARRVVLNELERSCGQLLRSFYLPPGGGPAEEVGRLRPTLESEEPSGKRYSLPIGLWVLSERAHMAGLEGDYLGEYEDLYRILYTYPELTLPGGTAYDVASRSIARRKRLSGQRGFEGFEARASELLAEAIQDQSSERLEKLARLYPHTQATKRAHDQLLQWATEESDIGTIARILQSELSADWQARSASLREVELLLWLGEAALLGGNLELQHALVSELARHHGRERFEMESHAGANLGEVARRLPDLERNGFEPEPVEFGSSILPHGSFQGLFEFLGEAQPALGMQHNPRVLVFALNGSLIAFGPQNPTSPLWRYELPGGTKRIYWTNRFTSASGRVIVATRDRVVAVDQISGEHAWEWSTPGVEIEGLTSSSGVVLATMNELQDGSHLLQALEARSGAELWRTEQEARRLVPLPLCGAGKAVFLPKFGEKWIAVRDLFSGRPCLDIELAWPLKDKAREAAWISGERLIIPRFRQSRTPERNHVVALNLESGREDWILPLNDDGLRALESIVQHGRETYLYLRPGGRGGAPERPGYLVQLHTDIGAKRRVGQLEIDRDDVLVGVLPKQVTTVSEPFVFLRSPADGGQETLLRAIHLPHGERWAYRLNVAVDDLYPMPLPVLSQNTVVLGYSEWPKTKRSKVWTNLLFLDRVSGTLRDTQLLHPKCGGSGAATLHGLGAALLAHGVHRDGDGRLEIYTE